MPRQKDQQRHRQADLRIAVGEIGEDVRAEHRAQREQRGLASALVREEIDAPVRSLVDQVPRQREIAKAKAPVRRPFGAAAFGIERIQVVIQRASAPCDHFRQPRPVALQVDRGGDDVAGAHRRPVARGMARRVVQPPEIVARQEGREDASVNLMADARLHLWMQPRAEQQHQFRELSPGQRREQPHLRIGDIRQIGVMRGQLPTALLADRPGHIQQWIEEPALVFQAFRQG